MEHIALVGSTLFYFLSFCFTLIAVKAGQLRPGSFSFGAMAGGVVCQTWFLMLRGGVEHACPIGTLAETLIFLSWSVGLFYMVIGPVYRISLMGFFTAPLILILQGSAFFLPHAARFPIVHPNPWVEAHAALSLIAFGAWGLSCVAGIMFLVQERQLKSQHPSPIFHHLPPISLLAEVTVRLLWVGFILLTISFIAGFLANLVISGMKFWSSLALWGLYFIILLMHRGRLISDHRLAMFSMGVFLLALLILPCLHYFSIHL